MILPHFDSVYIIYACCRTVAAEGTPLHHPGRLTRGRAKTPRRRRWLLLLPARRVPLCLACSKYFDIDYDDVKARIRSALILTPPFHEILGDRPDLYGPFWIATTLVAIIVASSSIMVYLSDDQRSYNFNQISVASSLVMEY
jgi:hypothetical protein